MKEETKWRTGRKVGRTIYDEKDRLIGMMDTPELAALAARAPEMALALAEREALLRDRDELRGTVLGLEHQRERLFTERANLQTVLLDARRALSRPGGPQFGEKGKDRDLLAAIAIVLGEG